MKLLIISDSHGNITNLKHVLGFAKKIKCGAVIHCGDWNNLESVNAVINFNIPLYGVIGNADINPQIAYRLQTTAEKFADKFLKFTLDKIKIGVVHNFAVDGRQLAVDRDIIFCGHTHRQEQVGNVVNPGALENSINFAIYDTTTNKVEFINDQLR